MLRNLAAVVSVLSLAACLASPLLYFWGTIDAPAYKQAFLLASISWFAAAATWAARKA